MRRNILTVALVALVLSSTLWQAHRSATHARAQTLLPCSGTISTMPMRGRYTGAWHSDGDYHFAVFNTDLDLKIIINGSLDVTVGTDGNVSGTATGTVDAPIYHDGIHDVSSGTGTISGLVNGVVSPGGSQLVLSAPVIAMQWGTFIAGGYTVPRSITMPDYHFPVTGNDCVSFQGSISEQNFPVQYVVADGASGLTQAPGIGAAQGTWSVTHAEATTFASLSHNIDSFIATANAAISGGTTSLEPTQWTQTVTQPLQALVQSIQQHPDISRCLLERLSAWTATAVPPLYARSLALTASATVSTFRQASDTIRLAHTLEMACTVSDGGATATLTTSVAGALDDAIAVRHWADAALLIREAILLSPSDATSGVLSARVAADIHADIQGTLTPAAALDTARFAYGLGDDADALKVLTSLHPGTSFTPLFAVRAGKKHGKKHKKLTSTRTPTPMPTARAKRKVTPTHTPAPSPTPTPRPSLRIGTALQAGNVALTVTASTNTPPTFTWNDVPGAQRYIVEVLKPSATIAWSWSGTSTAVTYGDTAVAGLAGSASIPWETVMPADAVVTVLAIDEAGTVIGSALQSPISR